MNGDNSHNLQREHVKTVIQLAKPGKDIYLQMTPHQTHLMHMLVGMAGELCSEIMTCTSKGNFIEKMGDIEFYFEGARQYFGFTYFDIDQPATEETLCVLDPFVLLPREHAVYWTGELIDYFKRVAVYRKDMPTDKALNIMRALESALKMMREQWGVTRDQCLEHNINKLLKGKNARYAEGNYSDEQANLRRDKADENKVDSVFDNK